MSRKLTAGTQSHRVWFRWFSFSFRDDFQVPAVSFGGEYLSRPQPTKSNKKQIKSENRTEASRAGQIIIALVDFSEAISVPFVLDSGRYLLGTHLWHGSLDSKSRRCECLLITPKRGARICIRASKYLELLSTSQGMNHISHLEERKIIDSKVPIGTVYWTRFQEGTHFERNLSQQSILHQKDCCYGTSRQHLGWLSRCSWKKLFRSFLRKVRKSISEGDPLIWGLCRDLRADPDDISRFLAGILEMPSIPIRQRVSWIVAFFKPPFRTLLNCTKGGWCP